MPEIQPSPPSKEEKLYLPPEAAAALRSSTENVRRKMRTGKIRAIRFGNRWRIPGSELERLLREGL